MNEQSYVMLLSSLKGQSVLDAEIVQDVNIENRQPGKVIFNEAGYPVVTCGEGLLKILDASIEGDLNTQNFVPTSKLKFRLSY